MTTVMIEKGMPFAVLAFGIIAVYVVIAVRNAFR